MSRLVDLTKKLTFDTEAQLKITDDFTMNVNISAETTVKMVAMMDEEFTSKASMYLAMAGLFFDEKEWAEFMKMGPTTNDMMEVIEAAMDLVTGDEVESSGE